ncbi:MULTISPECIES: hypothetical protein [Magnetospirillum]|uniref:Uncharacterized protein n=1 Tax=Magnetospirillum moscoviense TaxID=1437059 RepID=A0A178MPY9_9PROT|nr:MULTISPECIES: hypothetical protein [Magnetospirillum]MBF0327221.1 hypothetical protein [Alphaproteobacteria bacterium]OAN50709.1 hypothetical protein A6A05_11945 [Magnetospirillum moscoviense]CAA7620661.1 conserved hypothetical protein [Magnetospirillum sp. LM-5]
MLGHAELREIDEALAEERAEGSRSDKNGPYIIPHFAFGMAVTRAAAAGIKPHFPASILKR